ncbi:unnamed protein product [Ceutorhynchus assimilis]|uniref:Protein phosphatase 1 regulatory subunit 21 N-terminal domain-containing protein n=1 Tax=Ceutorhynchus assimilis TaxID=467358 RepID=A0A9N9MPY9_9CUCU|nr:unnamed protein product [Ceutorhynchus assimilis]
MEKQSDLETKYQRLAAEYSKVRSQATVLKKAVLDEQARSSELKDAIKKHEQTMRKHDQEMESLTFRNEQLTKRISVLQQELQINCHTKKGKQKPTENNGVDLGILDEEFQKKILENAQLLSSISDKDIEIVNHKERIEWLEEKIKNLEKELGNRDAANREKFLRIKQENEALNNKIKEMTLKDNERRHSLNENDEKILFWKTEAEKLKTECELLRSKPTSNEKLTEYYETQLRDMLEAKTLALSETKSIFAENQALKSRLDAVIFDFSELQKKLEKSYEELLTTNQNYRSQLDAMTEHLAAQNEKITGQCDEIQILRHKLSAKK